jgi:hypothetical protein
MDAVYKKNDSMNISTPLQYRKQLKFGSTPVSGTADSCFYLFIFSNIFVNTKKESKLSPF